MSADEGSGWIVEPPGADASRITINVDDMNQLTPELRDALDTLVPRDGSGAIRRRRARGGRGVPRPLPEADDLRPPELVPLRGQDHHRLHDQALSERIHGPLGPTASSITGGAMSDQSDDSGWVVEPGVEIQIAVGPDAELTPEIREALDGLVRALETEPEVEGFRATCGAQCKPPGFGTCNPKGTCTPQVWMPCFKKDICSVTNFA